MCHGWGCKTQLSRSLWNCLLLLTCFCCLRNCVPWANTTILNTTCQSQDSGEQSEAVSSQDLQLPCSYVPLTLLEFVLSVLCKHVHLLSNQSALCCATKCSSECQINCPFHWNCLQVRNIWREFELSAWSPLLSVFSLLSWSSKSGISKSGLIIFCLLHSWVEDKQLGLSVVWEPFKVKRIILTATLVLKYSLPSFVSYHKSCRELSFSPYHFPTDFSIVIQLGLELWQCLIVIIA